jgi:hypothetical protein
MTDEGSHNRIDALREGGGGCVTSTAYYYPPCGIRMFLDSGFTTHLHPATGMNMKSERIFAIHCQS